MNIEEIKEGISEKGRQLRSYIIRVTSEELSQLSEPCYYPKLHRYYYELLNLCKLTEKELKIFIKDTYFDTKARHFLLINEPYTNLILIMYKYFLDGKDLVAAQTCMIFLHLKFYSSVMNINIKYCNPPVFKAALDNVSRAHLFRREKTIANSLMYLSDQISRAYRKDIEEWDVERIIRLIQEARSRISQSVKSFAKIYYDIAKGKGGYKAPPEYEEEEEPFSMQAEEQGRRLIDGVVQDITMYKNIDLRARDEAKKLTKISSTTAKRLTEVMGNPKFSENISLCLSLFLRGLKNISNLCKSDYFDYVRGLMAVKRSTKPIYFKQEVNKLTKLLCAEFRYLSTYEKLSAQSKFMTNLFIAFYITMFLRNKVC